jgi:hypothetical protein
MLTNLHRCFEKERAKRIKNSPHNILAIVFVSFLLVNDAWEAAVTVACDAPQV